MNDIKLKKYIIQYIEMTLDAFNNRHSYHIYQDHIARNSIKHSMNTPNFTQAPRNEISITKYTVYNKWTLLGSFDTIQEAVHWIEETFMPSVQSKLVLMQESIKV